MKRKIRILAMLAVMTVAWTGCTGFSAGGTISPATFLLPGIIKNDSPPPNAPPVTVHIQVARAD